MRRVPVAALLAASLGLSAADAATLRFGLNGLPPAKGNPFFTTATTTYIFFAAMFDTLTQLDDQGRVHPWIATAWTPLAPTRWHFTLRPGVTFSNGEALDAAAVKANFDFLLGPGGVGQSMAQDIDFIKALRVIDALTIEIETHAPNIFLPRYLAGTYIVPPAHLAKVGLDGFASAPVGSGPFQVDTWAPEKVTFSAFAGSWRAPKIARLEILALPEATARMQALETGQADVITNVSPDHYDRLQTEGFRFHRRNPTRTWVIALDAVRADSPLKDARVRQALNYAVNRQAIADSLMGGMVEIASQPAVKAAVGYDPSLTPYPYDPDKARALLKEAGAENGFSFVLEMPAGQLANDAAVSQQVARDLSAVGVTMQINNIGFAQAISRMNQGGWKGHALQTDFSAAPPLDLLRAITRHSCGWVNPWYCDPAIEPVIAAAHASFDEAERTALTQQVNRAYRDAASAIFLFPVLALDGLSPRITRWEPWNDNFMFHKAEVEE
jgi:peptide/nickel transport system substrate-binding protein